MLPGSVRNVCIAHMQEQQAKDKWAVKLKREQEERAKAEAAKEYERSHRKRVRAPAASSQAAPAAQTSAGNRDGAGEAGVEGFGEAAAVPDEQISEGAVAVEVQHLVSAETMPELRRMFHMLRVMRCLRVEHQEQSHPWSLCVLISASSIAHERMCMQGPVLPTIGGYQAFFQENGVEVLPLWASLQEKAAALAAEAAAAPPPTPPEQKGKGKPPAKGKAAPVEVPAGASLS